MRLDHLASLLGATLTGRDAATAGATEVTRVMTLEEADAGSVSFISNPRYLDKLPGTRATAVIADEKSHGRYADRFPCTVLLVSNAYVSFAHAVTILHPAPTHVPGVSPLAFVHPDAVVEPGATVMPLAYIGRARVGAGTVVYPHVFMDDDVEVGRDCRLFPHVVLMRGTRVGDRAIMHPGGVLGADGFGFAPTPEGNVEKIPQVGNVHVGDDVELGACTTIDRAALGLTRLGNGVKIDNQVQVAHNVVLGNNVIISGQSAIAGSAKLEDGVMVGGCSGVLGHLVVGKNARLAAASYTMHNIPAGETWSGIPAVQRTTWARQIIHTRNLDDAAAKLKALEKKVADLEARLAALPA